MTEHVSDCGVVNQVIYIKFDKITAMRLSDIQKLFLIEMFLLDN